jgi:diguanylate cyclase (GGDEF)-like protein
VSLLVLDLDALKSIVDRDGHLVGSRAIATVGRLISEQLRPGDSGARFGGDEFVAVLPETSTEDAVALAQRIRAAVEACTTPDDVVADVSMLTASIGVATFPSTESMRKHSSGRPTDPHRIKFSGKNGVLLIRRKPDGFRRASRRPPRPPHRGHARGKPYGFPRVIAQLSSAPMADDLYGSLEHQLFRRTVRKFVQEEPVRARLRRDGALRQVADKKMGATGCSGSSTIPRVAPGSTELHGGDVRRDRPLR